MDPKIFGRYQIIRKLAGGGMGRVYLAYDPVINRQVGLKLIDAGGDPDSIDVITAERRGAILQDQLAKRENGGRVAQIFEVGEREGYFYISMEYIEGEDLSEVVARGPLDPQRAVDISLDILDVLVKAHNFQTVIEGKTHRGIIHGDIKPRNIRITPTGQVKVLDFGIAKAVSMTRSLTFNQFGSIPYSSPERLQTGDMDARSDVWSVAIVLFEMLTGSPYFEALASSKLEWMIRNYQALQPSVATLPPGLRDILSRALAPALDDRFTSAAQFQTALHEWKTYGQSATLPVQDPDATRRTRRPEKTAPAPPVQKKSGPPRSPRSLPVPVFRVAIAVLVALFLGSVFTVVYEIRMFGNAEALRRQIDTGAITADNAKPVYDTMVRRSIFAFPLHWVRNSLRDRYAADADRVIADYREASESTPVTVRDWQRARTALNAAASITPDDSSVQGKLHLVEGHLALKAGKLKDARADFEAARKMLPHSADPHLGLALIYMQDAELDKAENELKEATRDGFLPGRREQRQLADGYRIRGERWMASGRRAHEMDQMQDAFKRAQNDLDKARNLYNSVAPFQNGVSLAERVSQELDKLAKTLAQAEQAQPVRNDTP